MYRLNITFIVEPHVRQSWLVSVRTGLLPLLQAGGFGRAALSRVLTERGEGHFTFSLLVELESMECYEHLTQRIWPEYASAAGPAFGSDVLWMISLMKEMDDE